MPPRKVSNKETKPEVREDELIADAIIKISEGVEKLLKGPLKKRAIILLLKDSSGVAITEIEKVLRSLESLKSDFCK